MGRKGLKRRSSFITIAIVLLVIVAITAIAIKISDKTVEEVITDAIGTLYISEHNKEYKMFKDSALMNSELKNVVGFGIKDNMLVGYVNKDIIVNIIEINPEYSYTYSYDNLVLYVAEKETGVIKKIPLNQKNYENVEVMELNRSISAMKYLNNNIYFIDQGTLYKCEWQVSTSQEIEEDSDEEYYYDEYDEFEEENEEVIANELSIEAVAQDITYDYLVIEDKVIYYVKEGNLIANENGEERVLDTNVTNLSFYEYRDNTKIVFSTCSDGQNAFKNQFNLNTKEIKQSIKNDTQFVPYKDGKTVYLSNDKTLISLMNSKNVGNKLYVTKGQIENIRYFAEGYILFEEDGNEVMLNIETKEIVNSYINGIKDLEYLK